MTQQRWSLILCPFEARGGECPHLLHLSRLPRRLRPPSRANAQPKQVEAGPRLPCGHSHSFRGVFPDAHVSCFRGGAAHGCELPPAAFAPPPFRLPPVAFTAMTPIAKR